MTTDKSAGTIRDLKEFKDSWTLENALYVFKSPTVDSKIWAEAVEWLLLYGPPHIQEKILSASKSATTSCFPDLKCETFSPDGEPCYAIGDISKALKIDEVETQKIVTKKEKAHKVRFLHKKAMKKQ